jgi:uncharacterized protein (DUF3084 family)
MSFEIFLVLLVLVLSGVIATLGDRIGTKVGKARLSLFNLRPKKTAVLVTIFTGMLISASTMGLLLLVSRGIRDRLLNFDKIRHGFLKDVEVAQTQLGQANTELQKANTDKVEVQNQLRQVKLERERVQVQLGRINTSLKGAVARQQQTEALRQQVEQQRNNIQGQLVRVSDQAFALRSDIGRLAQDRQILLQQRNQVAQQIAQRDQLLQQRNQDIQTRNQVIIQRENRLKELEEQQNFLQNELAQLEDLARGSQALLRVGVPVILRDQALTLAVVQAQGPSQAREAIDAVLAKANGFAFARIEPPGIPPDMRILQIEPTEVERLLARIGDGSPYAVRVIAAANYLKGEPLNDRRGLRVFIQVAPNRTIFKTDTVVMTQSLNNPGAQTRDELQEWLDQLISQANFYAKQQGMWASTSNIRYPSFEAVVQKLREATVPTEVRVIAAEDAKVAGPLKLEFVVIQNGEVVLRTGERNESGM